MSQTISLNEGMFPIVGTLVGIPVHARRGSPPIISDPTAERTKAVVDLLCDLSQEVLQAPLLLLKEVWSIVPWENRVVLFINQEYYATFYYPGEPGPLGGLVYETRSGNTWLVRSGHNSTCTSGVLR